MGGLLSDGQSYYEGRFLEIFLFFKFRRPNYHFVGSNRTSNLLKNDLLQFPTQSDADNLAKFVMDALNDILYDDNHRIVTLIVQKGWTHDSNKQPSTVVKVRAVETPY